MAFIVKHKEFYMSKSKALNGESVYDYKGKDEDVMFMLDHLGCSTKIYTERHFNIIQKLASYHGWEIMVEKARGN